VHERLIFDVLRPQPQVYDTRRLSIGAMNDLDFLDPSGEILLKLLWRELADVVETKVQYNPGGIGSF
jgi:hypothetical protein